MGSGRIGCTCRFAPQAEKKAVIQRNTGVLSYNRKKTLHVLHAKSSMIVLINLLILVYIKKSFIAKN